jgi:hypothetical protein
MKMIRTKTLLLASIAVALAGPVAAQDRTGENLGTGSGQVTPAAEAVATTADALSLAAWAREAEDAEAMLVAARMLASVGALGGTEEPEAAMSAEAAGSASGAAPTAASLFDEATTLAAGDAGILARITAARAVAPKGLIGGARSWIRDIPANSNVTYRLAAYGGYVWNIIAAGDGDTDVDMEIRDEYGNLICRDIAPYSRASCRFTPAWDGSFSVRIINLGPVWTRTLVMSN